MNPKGNILEMNDISLSFGGIKALSNVSFNVKKGEIFSIIGPNGAGKTSMLNVISGRYKPHKGKILYSKKDISKYHPNSRANLGIGRTFQNLALFDHMTVLDNILIGRHHLLKKGLFSGSIYWLFGARKEEIKNREEIEEIIDFLEINNIRRATAGTLSYGLRKRVELARAIAVNPDLILLDEPMAGMNQEEKEDMARFIIDLNKEWGVTIIMIEHDMGVVMDISDKVLVLDFGQKIAEGLPEKIMKNKRVQKAYLGESE